MGPRARSSAQATSVEEVPPPHLEITESTWPRRSLNTRQRDEFPERPALRPHRIPGPQPCYPSGSLQPGEPVRAPAETRRPMKFFCASTVPAPKHNPRMSR